MPNTVPWALSQTQVAVEAVATVAFALSGVIEGARKRLDAVGICVVAGLAAFGGGTVRDILLDRRPLFWVQHASWVWALLGLCIGAPGQRHCGEDHAILAARHALYLKARERNPARWSGATRDWSPIGPVSLNPERDSVVAAHSKAEPMQPLAA